MNSARAIIFSGFLLAAFTGYTQKDTFYFDDYWQFCNKESASFYRIGILDSIQDKIFFRGPVSDYYANGDLEMEANYSLNGQKEGQFTFYYPGKKIKASGVFHSNLPVGIWEFYYTGDRLKQKILFSGSEATYTVIDYIDSTGKQLCKDGTGDFVLVLENFFTGIQYNVQGTFLKSKRNDTWKYFIVGNNEKKLMVFKEVYKDGVFRNGYSYSTFGQVATYKEPRVRIRFPDFDKFFTTELFLRINPNPGLPSTDTDFVYTRTQVNDTVYYNSYWQICERPFAEYYRLGIVSFDSLWSFVGQVRDYFKDNTLVMEGNYSNSGTREGKFVFYYTNGKISAKGEFHKNLAAGVWGFFYENGQKKASIVFADSSDFSVHEFFDQQGNSLCRDGACYFELEMIAGTKLAGKYLVKGEFTKGKRTGTWKYYSKFMNSFDNLYMKESYEKGELKKGIIYTRRDNLAYYSPWVLTVTDFEKLSVTESFSKDPTAFTNFNFDNDIRDLLVSRKSPGINLSGNSIEESLAKLTMTLNQPKVLKLFSEPGKIYNGTIDFRVSDSGYLKDVEVSGNLSVKEKADLLYILRKFENIPELIIGTIGIDAPYKIYYFTLDLTDMVPKRYRSDPKFTKIFGFWPETMEKVKERIREPIKRIIRYYY